MIRHYRGWEVVWLIYSLVNALAVTYLGAGIERISGKTLDTQYIITYLSGVYYPVPTVFYLIGAGIRNCSRAVDLPQGGTLRQADRAPQAKRIKTRINRRDAEVAEIKNIGSHSVLCVLGASAVK